MKYAIPIPDLKKILTWRNAFLALTTVCIGLFGYNFFASSGKSYMVPNLSGGADIDIQSMITDKVMTYGPMVLAALFGLVGKFLKIKPEYVQAALDFANNKDVEEVERRFVSSVVGMMTPLLGKYPELLLTVLKGASPFFQDHPKVLEAINILGAALVDAIFKKPSETTDAKTPNTPA